jgi:hypothetical protein
MEETKPRDYEGEVAARIAFDALWKLPATRTAKELAALSIVLGKPRTTETAAKP